MWRDMGLAWCFPAVSMQVVYESLAYCQGTGCDSYLGAAKVILVRVDWPNEDLIC